MFHDTDRTVFETDGAQEMNLENWLAGESAQAFAWNNSQQEYESPLNEQQELELATELLEVTNEAEFEAFLGKLMSKARTFAQSPGGQLLKKGLRFAAKKLLPVAGRVVGGMFGGPIGASLGGKLGGLAGKAFGLELEGLSAEDQEFEIARAYVRFASTAANEVAKGTAAGQPPQVAVQQGLTKAAQVQAPGLLAPAKPGGPGIPPAALKAPAGKPVNPHQRRFRSGTWHMEGGRLIVQL